jgi:hypothetical protein
VNYWRRALRLVGGDSFSPSCGTQSLSISPPFAAASRLWLSVALWAESFLLNLTGYASNYDIIHDQVFLCENLKS